MRMPAPFVPDRALPTAKTNFLRPNPDRQVYRLIRPQHPVKTDKPILVHVVGKTIQFGHYFWQERFFNAKKLANSLDKATPLHLKERK